jgi:hypothetical protein
MQVRQVIKVPLVRQVMQVQQEHRARREQLVPQVRQVCKV